MISFKFPQFGPGVVDATWLVLAGAALVVSGWQASGVLTVDNSNHAKTEAAVTAHRAAPGFDARAISGMHVFGVAVPVVTEQPEDDRYDDGTDAPVHGPALTDALAADAANALPATALPIRLSGIIHTSDKQASAILAGGSIKGQKRYKAGDTIAAGVAVERVEPRSVVIRNRGRLEHLSLPRIETASPAAAVDAERHEAALASRAR